MATTLSTAGASSHTRFLRPTRARNPNGISMGSTVSARITVEYPYTLQWDARFPKNCPFPWGHLVP